MSFHYELIDFKNQIPIKSFIVEIGHCAPHLHDEVEIIFVIKGSVHVVVSNKNYLLNTDDFLVVNSREIHYFQRMDDGNAVLIIQLDPNIAIMPNCTLKSIKLSCSSTESSDGGIAAASDKIRNDLKYIIYEMCRKEKHYELAVYFLALRMLTNIFRNFPYRIAAKEELQSDSENLDRIIKIFQFVEENYMHNITLHDAASLVHLNDYYFAHFFKKHTGLSFGKYLTKIRLEKTGSETSPGICG